MKPFKFENIFSPDIRFTEATSSSSSNAASQSVNIGGLLLGTNSSLTSSNVNGNNPMKSSNITDQLNLSNKPPLASSSNQMLNMLNTPQQMQKQMQTPSTLKNTNIVISATPAMGLHKQLRYEDSPSILNNQTCELGSFKYVFNSFI